MKKFLRPKTPVLRPQTSGSSAPPSTPPSREELAARRQRLAEDGALAMKEYLAEQKAIAEKTARLRAERLAREAKDQAKAQKAP